MTQEFKIPEIGTVLIGRSIEEVAKAGASLKVAQEGKEYEVVSYFDGFGVTDLVISDLAGTFTVEPDFNGHNYLTFFKHKEG